MFALKAFCRSGLPDQASPGIFCVWIATSRCSPNKNKLREQCSPRSLFDVNFSKRLFRLCGRHLFLVEFHQLGHTGAFAGSGGSSFCKSVSVHNGAVIISVGFAEFRRHGQFIIQVGKAAVRVKSACVQNRLRGLFDFGFLLFGWCRPREVVDSHFSNVRKPHAPMPYVHWK